MKLSHIFSGTKVLYKDKKIKVIRDFTWGAYIQSGGLTQSGGIVSDIWRKILKEVLKQKPIIENTLILGLGGGSAANLVSQYWVNSKITGVDIDPKIVELGKKYLKLDSKNINIVIEDAFSFVKKEKKQYDLILVDLYSGKNYPNKLESDEFLKDIQELVIFDGVVVFNRLYGSENRSQSMKFGSKLEKLFKKVDYIYPAANLALICYTQEIK